MLAAVVTSNGATGSYIAMHDSFMPLSVAILLMNMLIGEVVFGGLGTGLYSIVILVLVALFIGGLMTGRTPEFLGKTLGPWEMKLIAIYTLVTPLVSYRSPRWLRDRGRGAGPDDEFRRARALGILFAYSSCIANNGQTMAGLNANSVFYNLTTIIAMLAGRFGLAIPALALTSLFARQGRRPATKGTLPIDTPLFGGLTIAVALIVAGLNFLPALTLGPILEHFRL